MANAGRVAIVPKGDYSSSTAYKRLDLVRYNEKAYVAKKANTGIVPTNTEYWMLMTSDGIAIDTALSDTSTNAVQNKVIKSALDNIQTTSRATLSQAGWYRVAEYAGASLEHARGSLGNGCLISIKEQYYNNPNSEYLIKLSSANKKQRFDLMSAIHAENRQSITKIRYAYDTATNKAYIELYEVGSPKNGIVVDILFPTDALGYAWKKLDFIPTSETVSGVTVTTTYDIPANASPVTNLDLVGITAPRSMPIGTDLNVCLENGLYFFANVATDYVNVPNGYAHNGLMYVGIYDFGVEDSERIFQVYVSTNQNIAYFRTSNGSLTSWKPWKTLATTEDLANYLPKSGGLITGGDTAVPLTVSRTNGDYTEIGFRGTSGGLGYLGFSDIDKPVFENSSRNAVYPLLHTGNSQKVAITDDAPSDTTALWVDTANKKVKAYIDGAWTALA